MARKQHLSVRAYSFNFRKYRTRGEERVLPLDTKLDFELPDGTQIEYASALDIFKDFIAYSEQTADKEDVQQLFRCEIDPAYVGETEKYHYMVFSVFSGYYGFASEVIDRKTKAVVHSRTKDEADVKEFYVMVVIPKLGEESSPNRGLIFFQEIGVYGVKTVTANALQEFVSKYLKLTFRTQNLAPDFYLDKLFEKGNIKKIRLARNVESADSADRLYGLSIGREERAIVPLQVTDDLKRQLRHVSEDYYHFYTFDNTNYPEVKMEVTIGGRTRTINLHGLDDLSIEESLPDELLLADGTVSLKGFLEHMHSVAEEYLEHLPCNIE